MDGDTHDDTGTVDTEVEAAVAGGDAETDGDSDIDDGAPTATAETTEQHGSTDAAPELFGVTVGGR